MQSLLINQNKIDRKTTATENNKKTYNFPMVFQHWMTFFRYVTKVHKRSSYKRSAAEVKK